jgi:hypothetical protein
MKSMHIEEVTNEYRNPRDRWTPIPPNGRCCQFTGLKHARLYRLLADGGLAREHVRIVNLRTPGAKRGQTLFHVGDMLEFLDSLATKQGGGRFEQGAQQ